MSQFWSECLGDGIAQGDLIRDCPIPIFPANYVSGDNRAFPVSVSIANLIVITQSCDLENDKVPFVSFCPYLTLAEISAVDTKFLKAGERENIRRGRYEGFYMLPSPDDPTSNGNALIVDFREIYSLPIGFVKSHATSIGKRPRLNSPYLEHFSQAFARYFMRVGLPSSIPAFK